MQCFGYQEPVEFDASFNGNGTLMEQEVVVTPHARGSPQILARSAGGVLVEVAVVVIGTRRAKGVGIGGDL